MYKYGIGSRLFICWWWHERCCCYCCCVDQVGLLAKHNRTGLDPADAFFFVCVFLLADARWVFVTSNRRRVYCFVVHEIRLYTDIIVVVRCSTVCLATLAHGSITYHPI